MFTLKLITHIHTERDRDRHARRHTHPHSHIHTDMCQWLPQRVICLAMSLRCELSCRSPASVLSHWPKPVVAVRDCPHACVRMYVCVFVCLSVCVGNACREDCATASSLSHYHFPWKTAAFIWWSRFYIITPLTRTLTHSRTHTHALRIYGAGYVRRVFFPLI